MRILFRILAIFLSIDCVYGMEQENTGVSLKVIHPMQPGNVERRARHIVRSLVQSNLEPLFNTHKGSLNRNWVEFVWSLKLEDNNSTLDQQILAYLQTGDDPELQGCKESFKGVQEALMKEGIVLDVHNRLKLLTLEEQHAVVINGARPIVLSVVCENIKNYIANSKRSDAIVSKFNQISESYREQLDQDIVNYLINSQDPKYCGCPFSFKGIKEELKISEIVLNEQTRTLRFLTEREKRRNEDEYKKIVLEFVEI